MATLLGYALVGVAMAAGLRLVTYELIRAYVFGVIGRRD